MMHILAFLSQSVPRTNLGTRKRAANFSVSVSAASKALIHFRTFSEKNNDVLNQINGKQLFYNTILLNYKS